MIRYSSSVALNFLDRNSTTEEKFHVLELETRWHYSQHFLAEMAGESVLCEMINLATSKKQRAILNAQMQDEIRHTILFKTIVNKIGLDSRAHGYADGYSQLVKAQTTLPEKAFVFHFLTESISAAYCEWRAKSTDDKYLISFDLEVARDERRHLEMGKTLIELCDPDEVRLHLTVTRQKELLKKMNDLCRSAVRIDMLCGAKYISDTSIRSSLDSTIASSLIHEYRNFTRAFRQLT